MIDYLFFRELPIAEVLDALDIKIDRAGKFSCPSHEDAHPSVSINPKNPARWKCFSCGNGGTALDLVMNLEGCSINKAALILDDLGFKGGIREEKGIAKEALTPPEITRKDLKKIGLERNPFNEYVIRIQTPDPKDPRRQIITPVSFSIITEKADAQTYIEDLQTAAVMIADKIFEYRKLLKNYTDKVFTNFPELDDKARTYINKTTQENIDYFTALEDNFRQYFLFLERVLFDNKIIEEKNIGDMVEEINI